MRRILLLAVGLALSSRLADAKGSAKPGNFSGDWVLDTVRPGICPKGLANYRLAVTQDEQEIKVESTLEGHLREPEDSDAPRRGGGSGGAGIGGVGIGGGGMGGVGMGRPGGGMGGGIPGSDYPGGVGPHTGAGYPGRGMPSGGESQGRVAAFELYPSSAVYKLDGSQSTAPLAGAARRDATLKADAGKNGDVLKLTIAGSDEESRQIHFKDQWRLSKDGQSLMVDRTVHSRSGSGTLHLVFAKRPQPTGGN